MKPWDELSRTEKIQALFDYPASMRDMQAKDLWGPDAAGYYEHIYFPVGAPWKEIVEVIKNSHSSHTVYLRLTYKDFKVFEPGYIKSEFEGTKDRFSRHEYVAFTIWSKKILRSSKPVLLNMELYGKNRIACWVCTEEGDHGDEYGFGVEPDMWASALFDFEGNVIRQFAPGYIFGPHDKD